MLLKEVSKMDHFKVLKRALEITCRYRVLWVFGIILALTESVVIFVSLFARLCFLAVIMMNA